MANFDKSGMTQAGINLMGKAIGGATIQFTKLVLGDGEMTGEILDLQGVVSAKQNVDVTRIERNDNQCTVGGELLTSSVKQGFFWRECGLYALDTDGSEILYNYAYSTKPDYIPEGSDGVLAELLIAMVAVVGSANVNINIDDSMVFATKKVVDKKPYYYNSVADMKADTSLKEGDMIITSGYYLNDDGGGGEYIITNVSDGYVEPLENKLFAKLLVKKEIDFRQLGGRCDGITDDTEIFTKYKGDVNLIFPPSRVVKLQQINGDTITINSDNVSIDGKGCIFSINEGCGNFISVNENVSHVNIENFTLDYNNSSSSSESNYKCVGIKLNHGVNNSKIYDVAIINYRNTNPSTFLAVEIQNNKENLNISIEKLVVRNIYVKCNGIIGDELGSIRGIHISKSLRTGKGDVIGSGTIKDCHFENLLNIDLNGNYVLEDADAIRFYGYNYGDDYNADAEYHYKISDCTFKEAGKRCIKLQCSGVKIDGIEFEIGDVVPVNEAILIFGKNNSINNAKGKFKGMLLGGTFENCSISNIDFDGMGTTYAIYTNGVTNCIFDSVNIHNVKAIFKLNPLRHANIFYGLYDNIQVTNSNFEYTYGLNVYDQALTEADFNKNMVFKNCTFTIPEGSSEIVFGEVFNFDLYNCKFFINTRMIASNGLFKINSKVADITWDTVQFIVENDVVFNGKVGTISTENNVTIKNLFFIANTPFTEPIFNIIKANTITIDNIDLTNHTGQYALYIGCSQKTIVIVSNVLLGNTGGIRLGCDVNLSEVSLENVRRKNGVTDIIAYFPKKLGKISTLNVKGKFSHLLSQCATEYTIDSSMNIISDTTNGDLYLINIVDGQIQLSKI